MIIRKFSRIAKSLLYNIAPILTNQLFAKRIIQVDSMMIIANDHPLSLMEQDFKITIAEDKYGFKKIDFEEGDIVIDIGANIGLVSIYLAKKYPFLNIISVEPLLENYGNIIRNITENDIHNIRALNKAITKDGRELDMIVRYSNNSGGGTACLKNMRLPGHSYRRVKSMTLEELFTKESITRCKLLKIDCEGSEHEILLNTKILECVQYLSGEFHINQNLESQGYSIENLKTYCLQYIPKNRMHTFGIRMAE